MFAKKLALIGINTAILTSENMQSIVSIKSPIDGSVSNMMVNMGSYTEANNPVAEIVDNSQMHLDLYVYEKDLSKLKVGQTIHFTLTNKIPANAKIVTKGAFFILANITN